MDRTFKLSDGRELSFAEYGDLSGQPLFFFHGGPGSRLQGRFFEETAKTNHIRLIAVDRPGMGKSDFLPGRTILDTAKDIVELGYELGLKKFGVLGWSAGGPHALACAYAIPDKLSFCGVLAGFPPLTSESAVSLLDKTDQYAYRAAHKQPIAFRMFFRMMRLGALQFPGRYFDQVYKASSEPDRRILSLPGIKELMIQDTKECFRQSSKGLAHDARLEYSDWGFNLEKIIAPVHVWQGTEDFFVHFKLGERIAHSLPQAVFHKLEGNGHFFPITGINEVFSAFEESLQQ
jgi:pimeloyl-ACP methyl ester carboxylesterase